MGRFKESDQYSREGEIRKGRGCITLLWVSRRRIFTGIIAVCWRVNMLRIVPSQKGLLLYSRGPPRELLEGSRLFHQTENDVILQHRKSFGVLQFIRCPHDLMFHCIVNYNMCIFTYIE